MSWINEAHWPEAWGAIYFSPIVYPSMVYAGGTDVAKFYRYNLITQTWTELTAPPEPIRFALAMSPNGTKLAARVQTAGFLDRVYIYNIATDSWSVTSVAPNLSNDGQPPVVYDRVWADNDTIWCSVVGADGANLKCYRYTVSTDTWTQFVNARPAPSISIARCVAITSAGTAIYIGGMGVANPHYGKGVKYVIAADAYTDFTEEGGAAAWVWGGCVDRGAKLWMDDRLVSNLGIRYFDVDTETNSATIFPHDTERNVAAAYRTYGIYETGYIIAHHRTIEPKNRSYLIYAPTSTPTVQTDPATEIT